MSSTAEVLDLKRRAVALKREGDVKGAVELLRQAKQLEQQQKEGAAEPSGSQTVEPKKHVSSQKDAQHQQQSGEASIQEQETSPPPEEVEEDEDVVLEEDEDLGELMLEDGQITYTDEEMRNCEMMTEFKLGGMPVPSNDEYEAKIIATKKKALALKNAGDIAGAKKELACAKQLESVRIALSHMNEGLGLRINEDNDGWLEELSEPDSALVGNILNKSNTHAAMILDMDDIDTMSPEELSDAIEMGMELPTVEDIMAKANEKKSLALQYKQQGDLEGARTALLAYKELQAAASKVQSLKQQKNEKSSGETGQEISMEALESLVEEASGEQKQMKPEPKKAPPTKSAAELRQEAVRLRNEKKIKEATQVLKLYKAALQKEAEAAEKKRGEEMVETIRKEIVVAEHQRRFFQFYQRFVDENLGSEQVKCWNDYIQKCEDAIKMVVTKGAKAVAISRTKESGALYIPAEKLVDFVEGGADMSDERLEVAILDVKNIQDNKAFRKLVRGSGKEAEVSTPCHILKVEITIQIPPSETERDRSVELLFESAPCTESGSSYFHEEKSQFVKLPRDDSKFVNAILRRMERRKIQIGVYHVPHELKRKGWFGTRSSGSSAPNDTATLLGKVVLELKELLKRKCVAGDFPLMTSTRSAGGVVGLVVRTGVPFDKDQLETTGVETAVLEQFEQMHFVTSAQ